MLINYRLIGRRVREYRYRQNLNQAGLAEEADISVPYLSRIENGAKNVSLTVLIKIAIALDVGVDSFLLDILPCDREYGFDKLKEILSDCEDKAHKIIMDTVLATAEGAKSSLFENGII